MGKALTPQRIIKPYWLCFCWYVGLLWGIKKGYYLVACIIFWWVLLFSLLLTLRFEMQLTWAMTWCLMWNTETYNPLWARVSGQGRALFWNIPLPPFSRSTLDWKSKLIVLLVWKWPCSSALILMCCGIFLMQVIFLSACQNSLNSCYAVTWRIPF